MFLGDQSGKDLVAEVLGDIPQVSPKLSHGNSLIIDRAQPE